MIISDTYRFVFIHIPKCAGSYVRRHLKPYDEKSIHKGLGEHPELGKFDYGHIPLSVLRKYFFPEYSKVKSYFSFAIIRNPFVRFPSSLNQRLFMHKKMKSVNLTQKQIKREVDEAIDLLTQLEHQALLPADLIHFQRQSSFVYDEDDAVIDKIYTVGNVKKVFADLEQAVGLTLGNEPVRGKYNASHRIYKNSFFRKADKPIRPARKAIMRLLPDKVNRSIENSLFVHPGELKVFSSDYVNDFIRSFYKEDIKLYNEITGNGENFKRKA